MNERGVKILIYSFLIISGIFIGFILHPIVIDKVRKANDSTESTIETKEEQTEPTVEESRKVFCPRCGGGGEIEGLCNSCGGTGRYFDDECSDCDGVGRKDYDCDVCNGDGMVDASLVR